MFITFEVIEGCGKSSQVKDLDRFLRGQGFDALLPGAQRRESLKPDLSGADNSPVIDHRADGM